LYDSNDGSDDDSDDAKGEGHGTHVSSIAAARLDGDTTRLRNMQGVAYNASLVVAGFEISGLGNDDLTPEQTVQLLDPQWSRAFDFMVSQGARVINNSWGDARSAGVAPEQESLSFMRDAPQTAAAISRALAAGAVLVFSTGNDRDPSKPQEGMHPIAPAAFPSYNPLIAAYGGWIAVTATGLETSGSLESRMADYANYCGVAAAYCIAAPGGDSRLSGGEINGAKSGIRNINNVYTDNDSYVGMQGTSMASPIVSGAVALVAEKFPWMTSRNLVTTILTTATEAHNVPSPIYGRGLLDVNRAINGPAIFEETFEANLPEGMTSVFSNIISGDFGLRKDGAGVLKLTAQNSFAGPVEIKQGLLHAEVDSSLGVEQAPVLIFDGTLKLGDDFITNDDGLWHKPIGVGADGATIDTNGNSILYAGGIIDKVGDDGSPATLSFIGTPMAIAADLLLNADWNADLLIPQDVSLSGRGAVLGLLTMDGRYRPGNSPGTVSSAGSLQMTPNAVLEVEVDGPGTADGAGNYDRLLFTSPDSQFSADGKLDVVLRGISSPANNNFVPTLGQGFEFVSAPGGVSGTFVSLDQPTSGLSSGTQMDVVYGNQNLTLYVTPKSYADISAASVLTSSNRDGVGEILQSIRPAPGVRETDEARKTLFDALAPQTVSSLPVAMDQLAGVSYVELIGLSQQNTLFLQSEMASAPSLNRWGLLERSRQAGVQTDNLVWGRVIGRQSTLSGDSSIGSTTDKLGGVALGTQRTIDDKTTLGFGMAYGGSSTSLPSGMGSGSTQNLQLTSYGSIDLSDGYFAQAGLGLGGSLLSASRSLSFVGNSYNADIKTANIAANVAFGRFVEQSGWRYEWGVGLNYLGMRTFGFTDSGAQAAFAVSGQATNNTSLQPALSLTAGLPFRANETDWQLIASADYAYELADNRAYLNTVVLDNDLRIQSSQIGRSRLTVGLTLSASPTENSVFLLSVNNQFASNWNALSAFANLTVRF
jgi:autotransporter-associated beta strand protein